MKGVLCVPEMAGNPYQALLARGLVEHGFRLRMRPLSWRIEAELAPGDALVHLHWLAPLFSDPRPVRTGLKLALLRRALRRLQARGIPLVWTIHNLYEHERMHTGQERRLRRWLARQASALVVHTSSAVAQVQHAYGLTDASKIAVVPHGHYIDSYPAPPDRREARRRLGLAVEAPTLLFLGQVSPYKGVQALIEALARVGSGLQLVVAGQPCPAELAHALRAQARGVTGVQLRLEFVPDEEVPLYLAACDLFVLPHVEVPEENAHRPEHRFEILTSGSAILAMSFGRACIAPRNGYFGELLGEDGAFFFGPAPAEGLEPTLRRALAQRQRWDEMGRRNRAAIEPLGWDRVAARMAAVYARATDPREPGVLS